MNIDKYRINGDKKFRLADHDTADTEHYGDKNTAFADIKKNIKTMAEEQDKLYADNRYALLVIIQAMDAAGKDGIVKHVMSGVNPQGTQVYSFKQPSPEELDHDYLWRANRALPERGRIGIFNRSYYEDVLVVRVHNLVEKSQLPPEFITKNIWKDRFGQIRNFEEYLAANGTRIVKLFLHLSKEEQRDRFLSRIEDPAKNWKFSAADLKERAFWDDYQAAYEDMIAHTSTKTNPWHVIPADKKWFARLLVSEIIVQALKSLKLSYPAIGEAQREELRIAKETLSREAE